MNPEQRITSNFGGPTPPPAVEKKVFESGAETGLAKHDDGRNTGDSIEESQPLDEET